MWRGESDPEGEGAGPCGASGARRAKRGFHTGGLRDDTRTAVISSLDTSVGTEGFGSLTPSPTSTGRAGRSSGRGFSAFVKFSTVWIFGQVTAGFCRRPSTFLASSSPTHLRPSRSLPFPGPGGC